MKITAEQMKEAMEKGYEVYIVVNGEFYDFQPDTEERKPFFHVDLSDTGEGFYGIEDVYSYLENAFAVGPVWFSVYDEDGNTIADYDPDTDKCVQYRENAKYFMPDFFELDELLTGWI